MDSREGLIALRYRVGKLTGPDRGADADVYVVTGQLAEEREGRAPPAGINEYEFARWLAQDPRRIPAYTASVDAVLSLIGKVLPGWRPNMHGRVEGHPFLGDEPCSASLICIDAQEGPSEGYGEGPTIALALLDALLSALALPPGDTSNG